MTGDSASSAGWIPHRLRADRGGLCVDWCRIVGQRLDEPFFDQSIHRILHENPRAARATPLATLEQVAASRAPSGFIFHVSRCGSTLIAQMLASIEQASVFSEPAILETVLRGAYSNRASPEEHKFVSLKQIIYAFVASDPERRATIVKFSARAIRDFALIMHAFPGVPCLFVYRDPVEVLASLAAGARDRLPPGLERAGLLDAEAQVIRSMRPAEFWGRVIASQYEAALAMCERGSPLLVNYRDLPQCVWTDVAGFFGIALSDIDISRMQDASARAAKNPSKPFADDRAVKLAAATNEICASAEHHVRPYYERLEQIRGERSAHRTPV